MSIRGAKLPARDSTSLALAGILLCISAALHVCAPLVAGLHIGSLVLLAVGLGYFALARGFLAGAGARARLTLLIMLLGSAGARLLQAMEWGAPAWWLTPVIWADMAVAVMLVIYILRNP